MKNTPKELLPPTPQQVLNAITLWYSTHAEPHNYHSRIAWIEREFRIAFGGSFGTVRTEQLPEALDLICKVIVNVKHSKRSATQRLELMMEQIINSVGKGSSRASIVDAEALTSALQIARLEPDCPYKFGWASSND